MLLATVKYNVSLSTLLLLSDCFYNYMKNKVLYIYMIVFNKKFQ